MATKKTARKPAKKNPAKRSHASYVKAGKKAAKTRARNASR